MNSTTKRRWRSGALSIASALALTATAVFGSTSAAHADYVSPDDLEWGSDSNWASSAENDELTFGECSVITPEDELGGLTYFFPDSIDSPTGSEEIAAFLTTLRVNVVEGQAILSLGLGGPDGWADITIDVAAGVNSINLGDQMSEFESVPDLDLPDDPTFQDVLNALPDGYAMVGIALQTVSAVEVRWFEFGSETHWFGTDADWFLHDPTCGTATPDPAPAPTRPVAVETGLAG